MSSADPAFLLLVSSGDLPESVAVEAARAGDLDPHGLRLRLRGVGLVVAARGEAGRLACACEALAQAGARCAVAPSAEARTLPGVRVAGGAASSSEGISLRVHGKPSGPPPGEPVLLIFGDLGRDAAQGSSAPRRGDVLRQRVLRAVFPVIDIVWRGGRARVPLKGMAWRGLPGAGFSAAANFLLLFQRLAEQSGGAVLDLGFQGQDLAIDPLRGAEEPLEGSDRERLLLFERYAAAAAIAFARGLYPEALAGELRVVGPDVGPGGAAPPAATFARPLRPAAASPVPWIRRAPSPGRSSGRPRWWLPFAPVLFYVWARGCLSRGAGAGGSGPFVAGGLLAAGGVALTLVGLRAMRRRERLRAVPTSRVRSLAMGPVEVAGRVVPTASFTTPYSRTRCAWYRFEIVERSSTEDNRGAWSLVERGSSGDVPFRVEDESGSVLVQPAGARVAARALVHALDASRRVREWILAEGDYVFVAGYAHRRSVAEGISGGSERDDVFIGAGTDGFLEISPRSHAEQARRFGTQALLYFAGGLLSLLLAITILAS